MKNCDKLKVVIRRLASGLYFWSLEIDSATVESEFYKYKSSCKRGCLRWLRKWRKDSSIQSEDIEWIDYDYM